MKYYLMIIPVLILSLSGFSSASDGNRVFNKRPAERIVSTTRAFSRGVVTLPGKVVKGCSNGSCSKRTNTR